MTGFPKPDVSDPSEGNRDTTATKLGDGFAQPDSLEVVRQQRATASADLVGLVPVELGEFGETPGADNTRTQQITYPDGKQRTLSIQPDGSVSAFTDADGKLYRRDAQGRWLDPDGKPTDWQGVSVRGNTVSIQNKDGSITAWDEKNKKSSVGKGDVDDARLYPPEGELRQEDERIKQLIARDGGLNANGRTIQDDALRLGVSLTDLWHGRDVEVRGTDGKPGDGGELYRKWSEMSGVEERTSGHYKDVKAKQYQLDLGPGNGVVLFGLTESGDTWFQFERNAGRVFDPKNPGHLAGEAKNIFGNIIHGNTNITEDGHKRDGAISSRLGGQGVGPYGFNDRPTLVVTPPQKYVGNPQNA